MHDKEFFGTDIDKTTRECVEAARLGYDFNKTIRECVEAARIKPEFLGHDITKAHDFLGVSDKARMFERMIPDKCTEIMGTRERDLCARFTEAELPSKFVDDSVMRERFVDDSMIRARFVDESLMMERFSPSVESSEQEPRPRAGWEIIRDMLTPAPSDEFIVGGFHGK